MKFWKFFPLLVVGFVVWWLYLAAWFFSWLACAISAGIISYFIFRYAKGNADTRKAIKTAAKRCWPFFAVGGLLAIPVTVLLVRSWDAIGTPVTFIFTLCSILLAIVAMGLWALINPNFEDWAGNKVGNWARRGGCWKIWSTDNSPANSLLVVFAIWAWLAVLYGFPTPKLDLRVAQRQAVEYTRDSSIKDVVNVGSQLLLGKKIIAEQAPLEPLKPRFVKGWLPIQVTFWLLPLMLLSLCFSRRDEAADVIEKFIAWVRSKYKPITTGEATSPTPAAVTAGATATVVGEAFPYAKHLTIQFLVEFVMKYLDSFAKYLRKVKIG